MYWNKCRTVNLSPYRSSVILVEFYVSMTEHTNIERHLSSMLWSIHTQPHFYTLPGGSLHSAHLFLHCIWGRGEAHGPRLTVCCHGDGSRKACVPFFLFTEERKCDLMPCPDSPPVRLSVFVQSNVTQTAGLLHCWTQTENAICLKPSLWSQTGN